MAVQYTYYSAMVNGSQKSGVNRVEWEDWGIPLPKDYINTYESDISNALMPRQWGWEEITREYVPDAVVPELSDAQLLAAFNRLKELGLIK